MKHRVTRAVVIALTLATSACAMSFDSAHLGVTATMSEPAQAPAEGATFSITRHPVYLLLGLWPVSQPNLEDLLAGQLGAGTSIASLRIHVYSRWTDLLVTAITLGLVVPRSVTYEGVVVGH